MIQMINVACVLKDHIATLGDYLTGEWKVQSVCVFGAVPIGAGIAAAWWGGRLSDALINTGITVYSIFAGLLLSLLVLIYSVVQTDVAAENLDKAIPESQRSEQAKVRRLFLSQIHANVSFSILEAVSVIVLCLFLMAFPSQGAWQATAVVLSGVVVALTANFVLTLLMVLKRIHILIDKEIALPRAATAKSGR